MATLKQVEGTWQRFGSMINTGLIVGGLVTLIMKSGGYFTSLEGDIKTNSESIIRLENKQAEKWTAHEELHKNRLAEVTGKETAFNERLKTLEKSNFDILREQDNLKYRVTVTEQSAVTISTAIKDLQNDFNKQSSDLQVMKEILQRLDASVNRNTPARR
ncbi:hypothetical protein [Agrobacterium tumefaciens]|uniref:hypothetical protein n=1 Tax=Agrobacterium tumefaciens TaxID=358 RepID=UPI001FAACC99|nr:hypothetical protein [Agrobacterium tumefaciens]UNZ50613.1 hypothetical protein MLE07_00615 [Agrobacterium tumefaciens]